MTRSSLILLLLPYYLYSLECTPYKGNLKIGQLKAVANKTDISITIRNTGKVIKGNFVDYIGENIKYELETFDPQTQWRDTTKLSLRSYGADPKYFLTLTEYSNSFKYKTEFLCK